MRQLADSLSRLAHIVRRIIGAPDYESYLTHVRLAHPGEAPLTREQFMTDAMRRRYGRGAGRCC